MRTMLYLAPGLNLWALTPIINRFSSQTSATVINLSMGATERNNLSVKPRGPVRYDQVYDNRSTISDNFMVSDIKIGL